MNTETNGAASAERALSTGAPLKEQAAEMAVTVEAELEQQGVDSLAKRGAIRLQAVADLYFAAIQGTDNVERLDQLVKRWGWIQNSALRAWQQVKADSRGGKHDAAHVIEAIREASKHDTDE